MAQKAYLLLNINLGEEEKTIEAIRNIKSVKQAHLTTGLYDAVAFIEANSVSDVINSVVEEVRKINTINKTVTMLAFE
jgi:DNA-binding Lrp family transcriptional regulator